MRITKNKPNNTNQTKDYNINFDYNINNSRKSFNNEPYKKHQPDDLHNYKYHETNKDYNNQSNELKQFKSTKTLKSMNTFDSNNVSDSLHASINFVEFNNQSALIRQRLSRLSNLVSKENIDDFYQGDYRKDSFVSNDIYDVRKTAKFNNLDENASHNESNGLHNYYSNINNNLNNNSSNCSNNSKYNTYDNNELIPRRDGSKVRFQTPKNNDDREIKINSLVHRSVKEKRASNTQKEEVDTLKIRNSKSNVIDNNYTDKARNAMNTINANHSINNINNTLNTLKNNNVNKSYVCQESISTIPPNNLDRFVSNSLIMSYNTSKDKFKSINNSNYKRNTTAFEHEISLKESPPKKSGNKILSLYKQQDRKQSIKEKINIGENISNNNRIISPHSRHSNFQTNNRQDLLQNNNINKSNISVNTTYTNLTTPNPYNYFYSSSLHQNNISNVNLINENNNRNNNTTTVSRHSEAICGKNCIKLKALNRTMNVTNHNYSPRLNNQILSSNTRKSINNLQRNIESLQYKLSEMNRNNRSQYSNRDVSPYRNVNTTSSNNNLFREHNDLFIPQKAQVMRKQTSPYCRKHNKEQLLEEDNLIKNENTNVNPNNDDVNQNAYRENSSDKKSKYIRSTKTVNDLKSILKSNKSPTKEENSKTNEKIYESDKKESNILDSLIEINDASIKITSSEITFKQYTDLYYKKNRNSQLINDLTPKKNGQTSISPKKHQLVIDGFEINVLQENEFNSRMNVIYQKSRYSLLNKLMMKQYEPSEISDNELNKAVILRKKPDTSNFTNKENISNSNNLEEYNSLKSESNYNTGNEVNNKLEEKIKATSISPDIIDTKENKDNKDDDSLTLENNASSMHESEFIDLDRKLSTRRENTLSYRNSGRFNNVVNIKLSNRGSINNGRKGSNSKNSLQTICNNDLKCLKHKKINCNSIDCKEYLINYLNLSNIEEKANENENKNKNNTFEHNDSSVFLNLNFISTEESDRKTVKPVMTNIKYASSPILIKDDLVSESFSNKKDTNPNIKDKEDKVFKDFKASCSLSNINEKDKIKIPHNNNTAGNKVKQAQFNLNNNNEISDNDIVRSKFKDSVESIPNIHMSFSPNIVIQQNRDQIRNNSMTNYSALNNKLSSLVFNSGSHHYKLSSSLRDNNTIKTFVIPDGDNNSVHPLYSPRLSRTAGSLDKNSMSINSSTAFFNNLASNKLSSNENDKIQSGEIKCSSSNKLPEVDEKKNSSKRLISINSSNKASSSISPINPFMKNEEIKETDDEIQSPSIKKNTKVIPNTAQTKNDILITPFNQHTQYSSNTLSNNKIIPIMPMPSNFNTSSPVKGLDFNGFEVNNSTYDNPEYNNSNQENEEHEENENSENQIHESELDTEQERKVNRKGIMFSDNVVIMEYTADSEVKNYELFDENWNKIEHTPQKINIKFETKFKRAAELIKNPLPKTKSILKNSSDVIIKNETGDHSYNSNDDEELDDKSRSSKILSSSNNIKRLDITNTKTINKDTLTNSCSSLKKSSIISSYSSHNPLQSTSKWYNSNNPYSRCFSESGNKRFTYLENPKYKSNNINYEVIEQKNKEELERRKEMAKKIRNERIKKIPVKKINKEKLEKPMCNRFKCNPLMFFTEVPDRTELKAMNLPASDILCVGHDHNYYSCSPKRTKKETEK